LTDWSSLQVANLTSLGAMATVLQASWCAVMRDSASRFDFKMRTCTAAAHMIALDESL
jgi:hypothetical protein